MDEILVQLEGKRRDLWETMERIKYELEECGVKEDETVTQEPNKTQGRKDKESLQKILEDTELAFFEIKNRIAERRAKLRREAETKESD